VSTTPIYPVRVEGQLESPLSRWLWLVKWLLALPHYFVLAFLWVTFAVLSAVAFFAILFTGRYPRSIFEFNVGVLRWSWRVGYYAYGALGTDRYPPFTLAEVPDYPTHLEIAYPERLSRGLVLVKWLLGIPHYIIVGLLMGGGAWVAWRSDHWQASGGVGLIGLLVLVAGMALAFTGRYPASLFDLVLGLDRWVLRVAAYASLMTDEYPPFRLDLGGSEPVGTITLPRPPSGPPTPGAIPPAPAGPAGAGNWTGLRIVAAVLGALLVLTSAGLLAGGGLLLWADRTQRDAAGYLVSSRQELNTGTYALATPAIDVGVVPSWLSPRGVLDAVRIRVTAIDPAASAFVGIGPAAEVDRYLANIRYARVSDLTHPGDASIHAGGPPASAPTEQTFWAISSSGTGTRTVVWEVPPGSWTIVVMNPDGSSGIDVLADAGAKIPILDGIAASLLIGGLVVLVIGLAVLIGATVRAGGWTRKTSR
jgi:hypothetical protein